MVKSIQINAYECEVCGNRFFEEAIAEQHEKSPENPKFKLNEEVIGHYLIGKVNEAEYAATTFIVLGIKKVKHSFDYTLKLMYVEQYHTSGYYSPPSIHRGDDSKNWIAINEEDKKIIKSLEGKLNEKIVISEKQLSPQIYFRTSAKKRGLALV